MAIKFDPQFTEEQNRAYALMLLREGFEQLTKERREKALSLVEWQDDKGFLSDKQWEYVLNLATHVKPDKLSLNFAADKDVKPALAAIVDLANALIANKHHAEVTIKAPALSSDQEPATILHKKPMSWVAKLAKTPSKAQLIPKLKKATTPTLGGGIEIGNA